MSTALVLFAHGSRDSRWAEPFQTVAARVRAALPGAAVRLAYLELMKPDLGTAVAELAGDGATRIVVVPLFLGQGGHLREDLPRLAAAVGAEQGIEVVLARAAGEDGRVLDALAAYALDEWRARGR